MKVIFLSISYSENDHISFYEELLQEFVANGHEVFVACASEKRKERDTGISDERGIHVLRIKTGNITGNVNIIEKGISTVMIDKKFQKAIAQYFSKEKFDLILYPTPPITLVGTVAYLKKKSNAVSYLLLKDIFPQNAVDLGMLSTTGIKGIAHKMFRNKEKKLYRISDYIGCMSPANVKYVLKHNEFINTEKIEVCPNCVKLLNDEHTMEEHMDIRKKYQIPIDKKVFVYGGNLGKPQGIDFFLSCLDAVKDIKDAFILVVGGGSEADKIKQFMSEHNISNAMLLNSLPKTDYELLADACDVGLVFLDYRFTIPNFPSRVLSYMQRSKPVLVASDPNTDMGKIVTENGFGWSCISNDTKKFVTCIETALSSDLEKMGAAGRKYLENNYSVKKGYEIIMKHFE
nr:glycosyltransferase family 4 protein [uncultured Blautia sp.]